MSQALDAVLADHTSDLEVCVDIYSAKRSDGTLKTWTFSSHGRDLGSGLSAPPFLRYGKIGPLNQSLSEDMLFGGLAESSAGSVTIVQPWPDVSGEIISPMLDYTFAGYKLQVRVGHVTSTTYDATTFPPLRTAYIDQEPTFSFAEEGPSLSFPLMSALQRMMNEPLIVERYVGIPTCLHILTSTGVASRAYNAAYDLRRFTVMGRFKTGSTSLPPGNVAMMRRIASATHAHFNVRLLSANGFLQFYSTTGAVQDIAISSTTDLTDTEWHTFVAARNNDVTAYLMVDGGTPGMATPTGQTDIPANSIEFGVNTGYEVYLCDCRLYDRYITPEEARILSATKISGDDLGIVGLWNFDDNSGSTANDYSSNNLDATIAGVVNTDWKWDFSDLGDAHLVGGVYPMVGGLPFNAPAHLIDSYRQRYRLNTIQFVANETIKTQGVVLTQGPDYTDWGGGVFQLAAAEDEPITFDATSSGSDELFYVSAVARAWLTFYTRIAPITEEDDTQSAALVYLCPWAVGQFVEQDARYGELLAQLLGNAGLHYRETEEGRFFPDFLLPPVGLGPFGESMLDLRGKSANYVSYGNIASCSSSLTLACWIRLNVLDQTTYALGTSEFYFVTKGSSPNYSFSFVMGGADAGKLKFYSGATLKTAAGLLNFGNLYFLAAVFDDTANTQKIYMAQGSARSESGETLLSPTTLIEVASASSVTATPTTNSQALQVGGLGFPWGCVSGIQVWNVAKSKAQLEALMVTPPVGNESNLSAYIPLANGSTTELVTSTTGTINGNPVWCPKLTVNADDIPDIELSEFKPLVPAWKVVVRYKKNWKPLTDGEIAASITGTQRSGLRKEYLDAPYTDDTIRSKHKNAREVVLDSCLIEREDAERLARILAYRVGVGRFTVKIDFPPGLYVTEEAMGLQIGDEVRVTASSPAAFVSGFSLRVVGVSPNVLDGTCTIVGVG